MPRVIARVTEASCMARMGRIQRGNVKLKLKETFSNLKIVLDVH